MRFARFALLPFFAIALLAVPAAAQNLALTQGGGGDDGEGQKAVKQAEEIIRKAREATQADRDQMMAELKAENVELKKSLSGADVVKLKKERDGLKEKNKDLRAVILGYFRSTQLRCCKNKTDSTPLK